MKQKDKKFTIDCIFSSLVISFFFAVYVAVNFVAIGADFNMYSGRWTIGAVMFIIIFILDIIALDKVLKINRR